MKKNLESVMHRIKQAAVSSGRNIETVRLVSVTKTIPAETVKKAIDAGAAILGENYIQEARSKFNDLSSYPVSWHFIGHLQTNKAKYAVRIFDLIHSVDSFKLALELDKQARKTGKIEHILIQVNVAEESSKSGVLVQNTLNLVKEISVLENLAIKGLMTMGPYAGDPEDARPYFIETCKLFIHLKKQEIPRVEMRFLSMGMTNSYQVAIQEGANMVRIGTKIFGPR